MLMPGPILCNHTHLDSRAIITALKADGWAHTRTTGSHWHFKHPSRPGLVTVPHPERDLPTGTVKAIERQCGLKLVR